ncbi:hypothetical protein DNL40_02655 [Xylanimonas oleitrophica]|uniref:Uncharacterized protein n=1 Tax=Xylanimonas oleitrophica TaxID=2607479 RepID=A0A2W5WVU6_9MICO|nr:hypothetical protein [Xylanimonas oleitrophica]PZR55290.1 hypothetical protein DNL40_02655 [Xylanimonas oleitrophica]
MSTTFAACLCTDGRHTELDHLPWDDRAAALEDLRSCRVRRAHLIEQTVRVVSAEPVGVAR